MIQEFEILSQSERELMYSLPVYVAVLIAGADGEIDKREVSRANNIANDKIKNARKDLILYYNQANENFEDKLKMAIANLPSGTKERQKFLVDKIKMSNESFEKPIFVGTLVKVLYQKGLKGLPLNTLIKTPRQIWMQPKRVSGSRLSIN